jgi:hypothetical protein
MFHMGIDANDTWPPPSKGRNRRNACEIDLELMRMGALKAAEGEPK